MPGIILALAGLTMMVAGVPLADGALVAKVTNTTDSVSTTGLFSCASEVKGGPGFAAAYSSWPLNETGGLVAADVTGNGHPGTYSSAAGLSTGVTYAQPGPCPRDGALAAQFDGLTGSVVDTTGVATSAQQSDEVWFKTTTTAGGLMIGSYTAVTSALGGADRVVYMTTSGQVAFGTNPGTVHVIFSPNAYNDGRWHLVDAVLSATTGSSLYVDGALVASNASYNAASSFTTYTHVANGLLSGWTNMGSNLAISGPWAGTMAFATIYRYPITPVQVASQYAVGAS
jgi:hypothetical protein